MADLKRHFDAVTYKPKYFLGDRVTGKWNKIPFMGTVANDTKLNDEEGPKVQIFSDLPIKYKGVYHTLITTRHKDIKLLK